MTTLAPSWWPANRVELTPIRSKKKGNICFCQKRENGGSHIQLCSNGAMTTTWNWSNHLILTHCKGLGSPSAPFKQIPILALWITLIFNRGNVGHFFNHIFLLLLTWQAIAILQQDADDNFSSCHSDRSSCCDVYIVGVIHPSLSLYLLFSPPVHLCMEKGWVLRLVEPSKGERQ